MRTGQDDTRMSWDLIDGGPFEVHIARTFKLEDAAEGQQALNDHYLSKLALVLS